MIVLVKENHACLNFIAQTETTSNYIKITDLSSTYGYMATPLQVEEGDDSVYMGDQYMHQKKDYSLKSK